MKATRKRSGYNFFLDNIMTENRNMAISSRHLLNDERVKTSRSAKVYAHKPKFRKGSWNVRSIYQPGKTANIFKKIKTLQIDLLACSIGQCHTDKYQINCTGNDSPHQKNGVALSLAATLNSQLWEPYRYQNCYYKNK